MEKFSTGGLVGTSKQSLSKPLTSLSSLDSENKGAREEKGDRLDGEGLGQTTLPPSSRPKRVDFLPPPPPHERREHLKDRPSSTPQVSITLLERAWGDRPASPRGSSELQRPWRLLSGDARSSGDSPTPGQSEDPCRFQRRGLFSIVHPGPIRVGPFPSSQSPVTPAFHPTHPAHQPPGPQHLPRIPRGSGEAP